MPKWVWNPFEGDVTLPYMCACFNVGGEGGGEGGDRFFLAGS